MSTRASSRIVYGATPRADLLPESQRAERRHRQTMPKLLLAIVLSAALAGAIWAAGFVPVFFANQRLAGVQADSADLTAQLAAFSEVQSSLNAVNSLSTERQNLAAGEVLFVELLDEINAVLPDGVTILRYTGLVATDDESADPGDLALDLNPLCVAESATLTVQSGGPDLGPQPTLIRALEGVTGFSCVVGTKIEVAEPGGPQRVTVQLALDAEALALRFEEAEE